MQITGMRRTGLAYRLVFGRTARLSSFEEEAIEAVALGLDDEASRKLRAQIDLLPYRQRQDDGRILAFFPERNNVLPEAVLFNDAVEEMAFATVELRRPEEAASQTLVATFYVATRRFFSIDFDVVPSQKGFADGTPIVVDRVRIIANPNASLAP
jgi:hypothetical protein